MLYGVNGILGAYVAFVSIFGSVPGFWPIFIATIVLSIWIAKWKDAAMKDWISRCKFGIGTRYHTLNEEVSGFNFVA